MSVDISRNTTIEQAKEKIAQELNKPFSTLRILGIKGFCEANERVNYEDGYDTIEHSDLDGIDGGSGFEFVNEIPVTEDLYGETVYKYALISGHQGGSQLSVESADGECNAIHFAILTVSNGTGEDTVGVEFTNGEDQVEVKWEDEDEFFDANSSWTQ
ncbi:hypothetical protein LPJ53_000578 [Coemansia erecta]|uniref:Uncharacterized protein n=1 Tax=Coemansia erecta TaxID=147472 RepID=A0A9W7Y1Q2_9FUNG|nr:hypothetical protein LPJ53_000578 [Coemansia erecta]